MKLLIARTDVPVYMHVSQTLSNHILKLQIVQF